MDTNLSSDVEVVLEITTVANAGNQFVEANKVQFKVVSGAPDEDTMKEYLDQISTSITNVAYAADTKCGVFYDLNFEYEMGDVRKVSPPAD
ncbi:hypothetical protein [Vibrio nigripulchritudo]|nr:hypothetical protein [Vibrio nigripulchritudo]